MDVLDNWPAIVCVLETCAYFVPSVVAVLLNEFPRIMGERKQQKEVEFSAQHSRTPGQLLQRETWEAWGGALHPGWLLGVRLFAFCYLSTILLVAFVNRPTVLDLFFYYTQWTLSLLILYFGWGAALSIWEFFRSLRIDNGAGESDAETGELQAVLLQANRDEETAGFGGYGLQILFQVVSPAVVVTDLVYWAFLYPLFPANYPHSFIEYNVHGGNFIFLLAEIFLNSMKMFALVKAGCIQRNIPHQAKVPWIGMAYFFVWSCLFVYFQFTIHFTGWYQGSMPYPFMEVSTPYSPIWYLALGLVHALAYVIVVLLSAAKLRLQSWSHQWLSTSR